MCRPWHFFPLKVIGIPIHFLCRLPTPLTFLETVAYIAMRSGQNQVSCTMRSLQVFLHKRMLFLLTQWCLKILTVCGHKQYPVMYLRQHRSIFPAKYDRESYHSLPVSSSNMPPTSLENVAYVSMRSGQNRVSNIMTQAEKPGVAREHEEI